LIAAGFAIFYRIANKYHPMKSWLEKLPLGLGLAQQPHRWRVILSWNHHHYGTLAATPGRGFAIVRFSAPFDTNSLIFNICAAPKATFGR